MRFVLALCLIVTAGFVNVGCSSSMPRALTPNEGVREDIQVLRDQIVELQRKAAVSEVEIARLREKVAQLEAEARSETVASRSPQPRSPQPVVEPAPVAVTPPPVIVERTIDERPIEPSVSDLADRDTGDESRAEMPTDAVGPDDFEDPVSSEPRPSSASEPVTSTTPVPAAGQAIYDRGYTLYHQGEFVEAEASFQRFLQGFATTDLADNALYWIGEARYARRDFRGALAAFRETVDRYPAGNKIPDSLLKAGDALEELGDVEGARQSYREVERRFPDSAVALIAAERLAALP